MSKSHELLTKLKTYKRRVFVLLVLSFILFPYGMYRLYYGHHHTGLLSLLPGILGIAMGLNYLRVILRHEKMLKAVMAEEGSSEKPEIEEMMAEEGKSQEPATN